MRTGGEGNDERCLTDLLADAAGKNCQNSLKDLVFQENRETEKLPVGPGRRSLRRRC